MHLFFPKFKNAFWTPSEKKVPQNWTNKQKTIFWQQERTHTDFLMDKNAFPMARFGCKVYKKSKTQNCHLCYFLRIPRSYRDPYCIIGQNFTYRCEIAITCSKIVKNIFFRVRSNLLIFWEKMSVISEKFTYQRKSIGGGI